MLSDRGWREALHESELSRWKRKFEEDRLGQSQEEQEKHVAQDQPKGRLCPIYRALFGLNDLSIHHYRGNTYVGSSYICLGRNSFYGYRQSEWS